MYWKLVESCGSIGNGELHGLEMGGNRELKEMCGNVLLYRKWGFVREGNGWKYKLNRKWVL